MIGEGGSESKGDGGYGDERDIGEESNDRSSLNSVNMDPNDIKSNLIQNVSARMNCRG